jgi:hypothetical protein
MIDATFLSKLASAGRGMAQQGDWSFDLPASAMIGALYPTAARATDLEAFSDDEQRASRNKSL